jgi:hypothetical protein
MLQLKNIRFVNKTYLLKISMLKSNLQTYFGIVEKRKQNKIIAVENAST